MIQRFLDGNLQFIEKEFHQYQEYYEEIAHEQKPELLWIGCSDSRVAANVVTNSKPGTIFVHRNVANIVSFNDVNFAAILEYAVVHLKIFDIVICGHDKCGGIQALLEGVEENYIADWLLIAGRAKEKALQIAQEKGLNREETLTLLSKENVKLQISHLKSFSLIRNLQKKGQAPRIHGWFYSVTTGRIEVLVDGKKASQ